jgi:hypothetical protein
MKSIMRLAVCTLAIAACGGLDEEGSEETATASSALFGWTPWVSEEQPAGTSCGDVPQAAVRAGCSGSYCDSMRLYCGTLPQGFTRTSTGPNIWSGYISDEQPGQIGLICPWGAMIDGIRATGSYGDNVSIHCVSGTYPPQGLNCVWSPWFSEEQGTQVFDISPQSYAWAVAIGIKCSGSYCDNMSYYICEPNCRSNADCFGACVNGVCTVG